jgi:serine/threonine protein phosphatase PrpC
MSASAPRWLQAACATDVGRVREVNEDRCLVATEQGLFLVADGMGGHRAGDVAAEAVVSVLPGLIAQRLAGTNAPRDRVVELILRDAVLDLSHRLRTQATARLELSRMGSTVCVALIRKPRGVAHLAHMGDSRIYLYRQDILTQLTQDHSVVGWLLHYGEITPEEARTHPARNRISRYVGMAEEVYPDVQTIRLLADDRLLICSDGLTGPVPDDTIAAHLRANPRPEAACQALVNAANEAGGPDNIATLVVHWIPEGRPG